MSKGNLKAVMHELNTYLSREPAIQRIIISGDNYYPDKIETELSKRKNIHPDKLNEGFNMLPKDIPINMIMGNHDLETNGKKASLYLSDEPESGDCKITHLEMEIAKRIPNIELSLFQSIFLAEHMTLILMIDTSIYSDDVTNFLKCYNDFTNERFSSANELIQHQNRLIYSAVEEHHSAVDNIIIVGHHPITGLKAKKDKIKVMNDIPEFIHVLNTIYGIAGERVNYYYLCADYHSYQHGYITLANGMKIEQYIAGIGGTELDPDINITEEYDAVNPETGIRYQLSPGNNVRNWGFLVCHIDDTRFACEPRFLSAGGSRKTCKKNKHNRRKSNKKLYRAKLTTNTRSRLIANTRTWLTANR